MLISCLILLAPRSWRPARTSHDTPLLSILAHCSSRKGEVMGGGIASDAAGAAGALGWADMMWGGWAAGDGGAYCRGEAK